VVSETTPRRRCSGYCGLPIPAGKLNTYQVIEPSGRLREFCDGDCLGTYYLEASREADAQARLAGLVAEVERVARERYDGHYTVLKFTTHYKACWGTPDLYGGARHPDEAPYWEVHRLAAYPTLEAALAGLLTEGQKLPEPPAPEAAGGVR
jgi:hypothetical protein